MLRVKDFANLLGVDALWQIAIKSQNEKAKEASQELLVDVHLKLDKNAVDADYKMQVIERFVKRCMD